jgi:hypothetical protein
MYSFSLYIRNTTKILSRIIANRNNRFDTFDTFEAFANEPLTRKARTGIPYTTI